MKRHVYMLRAGENHYKIGIAKNVWDRIASIQSGNSQKIELVAANAVANAPETERAIHKSLEASKLDGGREWFELTEKEAIDLAIKVSSYKSIDINELAELRDLMLEQNNLQSKIQRRLEKLSLSSGLEFPLPRPARRIPVKNSRPTLDEDIERTIILSKQKGRVSTSFLQANLGIGYGRASRIVNEMERRGLISEADGSRPRRLYF